MKEMVLRGLEGSDPLAFMAALGLLRVLEKEEPETRLRWVDEGQWFAAVCTPHDLEVNERLMRDVERWRKGHAALDFAVGADRKIQDLKHPPEDFRKLMRKVASDPEAAAFVSAFATGVAVDGSGQTKPTALHFTAGRQRFLDAVLSVREEVGAADFEEALHGPWQGRTDAKDTRWRAGSERSRALLSYDPGKEKTTTIVGGVWLAFQGMPLLPTVPEGDRVRTTGFTGRGRSEVFTWPLWTQPLTVHEARVVVGLADLADMDLRVRGVRGIGAVFQCKVLRSSQGYGNFAAASPA